MTATGEEDMKAPADPDEKSKKGQY